jgi:hypothetical protein
LSRSKSNVLDDPPSKKQERSEGKPWKKSYDSTKKFQTKWAIKVPWAKGAMSKDGMITLVKCIIYFLIEKKDKIMGYKWDTLTKHQGCQIASRDMLSLGVKKGGEFIAKDCAHLKNMKLYAKRGSKSILVQVNRPIEEGNRKVIQMKCIFHVLFHGCPMLKFESFYELFRSLNIPKQSIHALVY